MLDAFIIDELRRREEAERRDSERPRLELPIDDDRPRPPADNDDHEDREEDDEAKRGVVIISL